MKKMNPRLEARSESPLFSDLSGERALNYFFMGFHAVPIALDGVAIGLHGIPWLCYGTAHCHGTAMEANDISWAFESLSWSFMALPWVFLAPIKAMP